MLYYWGTSWNGVLRSSSLPTPYKGHLDESLGGRAFSGGVANAEIP